MLQLKVFASDSSRLKDGSLKSGIPVFFVQERLHAVPETLLVNRVFSFLLDRPQPWSIYKTEAVFFWNVSRKRIRKMVI